MDLRFIVIIIFIAFSSACNGQIQDEDDIPLKILKWHFHHYPKSISSSWRETDNDTKVAFFEFEGTAYKVIYLEDGQRLSEEKDMSNEMPVSFVYYLDDKYTKYKINEFVKVTDFTNDEISFRLKIKSKELGAEVLHFDETLTPTDFTLITKAN